MPQQRIIQTNFSVGEVSPRMAARIDLEQYRAGARELLNVMVQPQGGVTRRSGSTFVAAPKTAAAVVLRPFIVSDLTAYVLEFGAGYLRFYRNRAQLTDGGGAPLEVTTPYDQDSLAELSFAQSADVLYIAHRRYKPRKLSRTAANVFQLAPVDFLNGPYDAENTGNVPGASSSASSSGTEGGTSSGGVSGGTTDLQQGESGGGESAGDGSGEGEGSEAGGP